MSLLPTVRTLEAIDAPALDAFLCRHAPTSLHLIAALRTGGVMYAGLPHQAHYLAATDRHGLHGVMALCSDEMVRIQCPNLDYIHLLVEAWREWFSGSALGLAGARPQVDRLLGLLGGEALPFRLNNTETVLALRTAQIIPPALVDDFVCRPATEAELPLLCAWQLSLLIEAMHLHDSEELRAQVHADMSVKYQQSRLFILVDSHGLPLAMAQAVMSVGDMVQIGGAYVPPDLRGRGYSRALLFHLSNWLRTQGFALVTLMTTRRTVEITQSAQSLGFKNEGDFGLVLFNAPVTP